MDTLTRLKALTRRNRAHLLLRELGFTRIVEVGVLNGENLRTLLRAKPTIALAVDLWPSDRMHRSMLAFAKAHRCLSVMRMSSLDAASLFARDTFDFVYIDADHRYESVRADIAAWWALVRSGGILGGHDYRAKRDCGVIEAVSEFVAANGLHDRLHVTRERRAPSWYVAKP